MFSITLKFLALAAAVSASPRPQASQVTTANGAVPSINQCEHKADGRMDGEHCTTAQVLYQSNQGFVGTKFANSGFEYVTYFPGSDNTAIACDKSKLCVSAQYGNNPPVLLMNIGKAMGSDTYDIGYVAWSELVSGKPPSSSNPVNPIAVPMTFTFVDWSQCQAKYFNGKITFMKNNPPSCATASPSTFFTQDEYELLDIGPDYKGLQQPQIPDGKPLTT
ncbi:MAG: hypothetical protein Q9227_000739 [Pyrenula ochraceoflavens]